MPSLFLFYLSRRCRWFFWLLLVPGAGAALAALPRVSDPQSMTGAPGETLWLSGSPVGATALQWRKDGVDIAGATGPTLTVANFQIADAGVYTLVASNAEGAVESGPAVLAPSIGVKVAGAGLEVGQNIVHQNGNVYDQVLLTGAAAAVTADAGQITRVSFVDLNDDIVQVEFTGRGVLTVLLQNPSEPAPAAKYQQPGVNYLKGHASLIIVGANETTNVSAFTVGTLTAVNQGLFRPGETYDGIADLGLLCIRSDGGKFGGIRMADAAFFRGAGMTGIHAPGVVMAGPVFVGDITADATASPVLVFGGGYDVRITGGDLLQLNGRPVAVGGMDVLQAANGITSGGLALPAQAIRGRLDASGSDVTAQLLDSEPVVISRTPPVYPFSLRLAGITGEALIEFIVDTTGHVRNAFAVSATHPEFATASITAISQWLFVPARRGGLLVNVRMQQPISFSLGG